MTCREAMHLIIPFIHDDLDDETAAGFLDHIDSCGDCREELEIYYTVEAGIRQLDGEDADIRDIAGAMESDIMAGRQRLYSIQLLNAARYAADTLIAMGVLVMLALQLRLWWQNGIF